MTVFYPEATTVLGNVNTKAILTVADQEAISLATEWNAASSLELSCFLRPFNPAVTTGSGSSPNRQCTTITLPQEGRTEISAFELRYVYDPQGDPEDDENKAKELLTRGTRLVLAVRKGLDALTVPGAADQQYESWAVRMGRQNRVTSGDDDFAEFEISQMAYPVRDVVYGSLVA